MSFHVVKDDICSMQVDAIVNAANEQLMHGGGVAFAIARAAGWDDMVEASAKVAPCPEGGAVYTPGFRLPASYVIHTVGPIWQGGRAGEAEILASAYESSLKTALDLGCKSLAFPLISAGIYGYPIKEALCIAAETITRFLDFHNDILEVYLVLYNDDVIDCARELSLFS